MSDSKTKNSWRNLIFGTLNLMTSLLMPFIIRTIIIYKMGNEYVGLGSLFSSILSALSIAELGFGQAIVYEMYKPISEQNEDKINKLLFFYKKIYLCVGTIIFVVGLIVMPFIRFFINGSYPSDINLYVLYFIYLINIVLGYFLFSYRQSMFTAHQRNDIVSKIGLLCNILMYILQIVLLLTTKNYYFYVLAITLFEIFNNLLTYYFSKKKYSFIKYQGELNKEEKKYIYKNVFALIGHKVGASILLSFDSIMISATLGLEVLARYNNYYYILNAIKSIIVIICTSMCASLGNSIATQSVEMNKKLYNKIFLAYRMLIGWCAVCLLCLYQPFVRWWIGNENMFGMDTVILFAIYFYSWMIRYFNNTFKDACGMWKNDFWKPYIGSAVDLILNFLLYKIWGLNGIIFATIVTMVCIYFPFETQAVYKYYFKMSSLSYCFCIFINIVVTAVIGFVVFKINSLISISNLLLDVCVKGVITTILTGVLFVVFYCKNPEFKNIVLMLKNILHIRDKKRDCENEVQDNEVRDGKG